MIKQKTKDFADKLLKDPKTDQTQAYLDTHKTEHKATAAVNASKLLAKPEVQIYMDKHVTKAKQRITELVASDKEEIALKASFDILDRTYGRAIARQELNTTNLNFNIEANEEVGNQFTEFLRLSVQRAANANQTTNKD